MPQSARLAGAALGLLLIVFIVVAWRLFSEAADMFAPTMALAAIAAGVLSAEHNIRQIPILRTGLQVMGVLAAVLCVAAALSLGAFLPPVVSEWISPALGRFGGASGLLLLLGGLLLGAVLARRIDRAGRVLHLGTALLFAAAWLGSQVAAQINFPPPPTTPTMLAPRLDFILWIAGAAGLTALLALIGSRTTRGEASMWPVVASWAWRWAMLLALLGTIVGSLLNVAGAYRFGLLLLVLLIGAAVPALLQTPHQPARKMLGAALRSAGWLLVALFGVVLLYFTISEDLEATMLRNTAQSQVARFWRGMIGDTSAASGVGSFSGQVWNDQVKVVPGATVLVADAHGVVYSAVTAADGSYRIDDVPDGNYLPLAIAPGYAYAPPLYGLPRVLTIRAGREIRDRFFQISNRTAPVTSGDPKLEFGPQRTAHVDNPTSSDALRRTFTYQNAGLTLTGGLVHEPPAALGPGPFPILLVVFPGPANYWEGISIPLAARGFVVISYFPNRLIDLNGDLGDLNVLLQMAADGKFSTRGDNDNIAILGGSMSTAYVYRMGLNIEGTKLQSKVKATVQYGGLFDMFELWHAWDSGEAVIDPGVSDLDYLVMAFGRPDLRPEIFLFLSPHYTLGPDSIAPTMLVHAGKDSIVPATQSEQADQLLTDLEIPHLLKIYPDEAHYLDTSQRDPTQVQMLEETVRFLEAYLK